MGYPGNDERYTTYAHDLPVSLLQSAIRSIAHGRIEEHPALPRAESLKDCMERVTPYYVDTIQKALDERKNVLVASSENAIRGLLMHLCEIPEDEAACALEVAFAGRKLPVEDVDFDPT